MPDIANLANHIVMPPPPGPNVPDSKPSAASQNADIDHADHFPPDNSKTLDPQDQATVAPRPDDDNTSTEQVEETGAGNFRDVLEKRLSEESDPQPESEKNQNTSDSDQSSSRYKPGLVRRLENTEPELAVNNKLTAGLAQLKSPKTTGEQTIPSHHAIVALPAKGATGAEVKTERTVPGRTHLSSSPTPAARVYAKGQPLQALKTDAHAARDSAKGQNLQAQSLKNDTTGDLKATFVRDDGAKDTGPDVKKPTAKTDTAKTDNLPHSNKKAGADQNQPRLNITHSNLKKPVRDIGPQLTKDQNADVLAENAKTDALLTPAKLSPTDAKNATIASVIHNGTPQGRTKTVRTATEKIQAPAASNGAKSATPKDTSDLQTAPAAARTNAVVADTDGSDQAAIEATNLSAKASNVSPALTARWNNSVNNAPTTAASRAGAAIQTDSNMQLSPAQQIIDSIRLNINTPQQQIYISLNPPELGRVGIMFRLIDGQITGILQVEKPETKYDIEQALPQIAASLQQSGVQVGRVNVIINDQNQQGLLKNNDMPTDDFTGMAKHGFTDRPADDNPAQQNSPQPDTAGPVTRQPSDITNEITDNTINIYV